MLIHDTVAGANGIKLTDRLKSGPHAPHPGNKGGVSFLKATWMSYREEWLRKRDGDPEGDGFKS